MSSDPSCYIAELERESLLAVVGPDAATFLQGQISCDVRQLENGVAVPGVYCTPQGRVVCDFLLWQARPEQLMMRLRADILEIASRTLGKYIIFSKAELQPASQDWRIVGLWGERACETLAAVFGACPAARYDMVSHNGACAVQLDEQGQRFECFLPADQAADINTLLMANSLEVSAQQWALLDIQAGIARIESGTAEAFIPQMLNYDLTGHIDFKKGCYTGQEVVARMHYRGKPKRRLYRATQTDPTPPAAGTPLFSGDSEKSVGNVINAQTEGAVTAVLVTATEGAVSQGLHLGSADGAAITIDQA